MLILIFLWSLCNSLIKIGDYSQFLVRSFHNSILLSAKISNRIESFVVLLGANPAIRCNLMCRTPAHKDFHCYRG
jgi:hypothetical protein